MKYTPVYSLIVVLGFYTFCKAQNQTDQTKEKLISETKEVNTSYGPHHITRHIIQDRKGNLWIATYGGVFRYDNKSFTNITSQVSSARFFSVLEDRNGNLWFGSLSSGVYKYDPKQAVGKSFQNFTTKDGLLNNAIFSIYEDKRGHIWFGVSGGASRYDGKSFRNYAMKGDSIFEEITGEIRSDFTLSTNEVSSIIEDKTGKFWFGTRGHAFVYDGKTFTSLTHNNSPFWNVRKIIEDKKGNIWLGGFNGLWRYDGRRFTNLIWEGVGYVYEDKKGNLWTGSESDPGWVLSRYEAKSLSKKKPKVTVINPLNGIMFFDILEAKDGSIWFGSLDGVFRYDPRGAVGRTITGFNR
ncbi:ligand-binding sensor domain-containing protein [Runella limosa]|uniref:ligand-binding sensor domain-containing protein n=1 Tax=Runella limosa TaxID=370978 RepID=UPI0004916F83|nr:two-component regulator propeller domain-containing protein [Runella limosa]